MKLFQRLLRSKQLSLWRFYSASSEAKPAISFREKTWKEVQDNYAKYDYLLYSSHLEINSHINLTFKKRKWIEKVLRDRDQQKYDWTDLVQASIVDQTEDEANSKYPKNWMHDYEFYDGPLESNSNINSTHGTADATIPSSTVPCNGCGAHLHCTHPSMPGFIPKEIFKDRTNQELQTIICKRCHFLKNYNIALDVEVTPQFYEDTIAKIQNKFALAVVIVDLLDMPSSMWPGMQKLLGPKRPVFIVGNKVDLLPRDSEHYLNRVKNCLKELVLQFGFDKMNVKDVSLISAKTGYGVEELITKLHKIWLYKGDVYILGCTNVGKSSLFNILLNSDYCRPEATTLVRKATTCPWPGTTLQMLKFPILRPSAIRIQRRAKRLFSERAQRAAEEKLRRDQARNFGSIRNAALVGHVRQTFVKEDTVLDAFAMSRGTKPIIALDERCKDYQQARWCYDTPGVMHPDQITNFLTTEELIELEPKQMISPRALRLMPNQSVFVGGLGRLDLVDYKNMQNEWIKVFIFASMSVPLVISTTADAEKMYEKYLGTDILGYPFGDEERLSRWPGLKRATKELKVAGVEENDALSGDITLSSVGWIGISVPTGSECTFEAWTPNGRGVYLRSPLVPYARQLIGKRIRNSLAYNIPKPFIYKK